VDRRPSSTSRRIALVTQAFTLGGGGVPTVARWLRAELRAVGYTVDVHDLAVSSRDDSSRRILRPVSWFRRELGSERTEEAVRHWGANLVEIEAMRYRPRAELTRALEGYDLIQVVAGGPALAAAVVGSLRPVVLQVATTVRWERSSRRRSFAPGMRQWRDTMTWWTSRIEQKALRSADAVLVENVEMLSFVQRAGQRNSVLAPPGVDTHRFAPAPGGWNADGYLLSVCRLSEPRKGLDRIVRAYQSLVRSYDAAPRLVLAGRGMLSEPVARLVRDAGLARLVDVKSDVRPDDLPDLYRGASVYVQASHEEGLGISVLEAMASGLPVVATATSGARETVVDGSTGWLVPQDHEVVATMCARLRDVLCGSGPAMAQAARNRCAREFSTSVALGKYLQVYDGLLG
jgi:glycosyltransferase involved in cell wall biosynthesis